MAPLRPRVRRDLAWVEVEDEAVVYDQATGDLHHLNQPATIVFTLCDGQSTVKELSDDISSAFGIPAAQVQREVRRLIREFRSFGLLEGGVGSSNGKTS
ncbi:MAG: HPr-rel-A system PqqD family peptide chaperone [Actinomycetota bacterium]